jgi:hypothetical protein
VLAGTADEREQRMSLENAMKLQPLRLSESAEKSAEMLKALEPYTARTRLDVADYFPELDNIVLTLDGLVQGCVESAVLGKTGSIVQPKLNDEGQVVVEDGNIVWVTRTGNVEAFLEKTHAYPSTR